MNNKSNDIQKIIRCAFLPEGKININASKYWLNKLSQILKHKYKICNELIDNNIYNISTIIFGNVITIRKNDTDINTENIKKYIKLELTQKEQDIIYFLCDEIKYGILKVLSVRDKKYEIIKEMPLKKTSYYYSYLDWIPFNEIELKYKNIILKKNKFKFITFTHE